MKWIFTIFQLELRKIFSYRVDFWIQFLAGPSVQIFVAFFLWKIIFITQAIHEVGGYSFQELMLYYITIPFIEKGLLFQQRSDSLSQEIYDGSLTRYLIYPLALFPYKFCQQLAHILISLLQLGLALFLLYIINYFYPFFSFSIELKHLPLFFLFILLGALLSFLISSFLELIAFWADHIWSLLILFQMSLSFIGGGRLPLSIFPEWSQSFLLHLPFASILYIPTNVLIGHPIGISYISAIMVSLFWILFFSVANNFLWRRGLKIYTGVGI